MIPRFLLLFTLALALLECALLLITGRPLIVNAYLSLLTVAVGVGAYLLAVRHATISYDLSLYSRVGIAPLCLTLGMLLVIAAFVSAPWYIVIFGAYALISLFFLVSGFVHIAWALLCFALVLVLFLSGRGDEIRLIAGFGYALFGLSVVQSVLANHGSRVSRFFVVCLKRFSR